MLPAKEGDIVGWAQPLTESEKTERMQVIEYNGSRCLVVALDTRLAFPPTRIVPTSELTLVGKGD